MPHYDLLIYHDIGDDTETTGTRIPKVGDSADELFGGLGKNRHVVAVAPPIHEGKSATVVLAQGHRPMAAVQALLDGPL